MNNAIKNNSSIFKLLTLTIGFSLLTACGGPGVSSETASGAQPAKEISDNKAYDDGEHIIHFNALASSLINADVAKSYNIVRSDNRALANISIHKKNEDGTSTPINADIKANVANLTGQLKPMDLKRVQEQSAIYYLGLVNVANGETLLFNLKISPEGTDKEIEVKYKQSFYTQ